MDISSLRAFGSYFILIGGTSWLRYGPRSWRWLGAARWDLLPSRRSKLIQYVVVLMFSYFQLPDGFQSDLMSSHIRSLKPAVHNARIGELFQFRNFSLTHTVGAHLKDMSSARNSTSTDTESAWVATLSPIFEKRFISTTWPLIPPLLLYLFRVEISRHRANGDFTFHFLLFLFPVLFLLIYLQLYVFLFFFSFIFSLSPSKSTAPFSLFSFTFTFSSLLYLFFLFFLYFDSPFVQQDKSVDVRDKSLDVSQASPHSSEQYLPRSRPTSARKLRTVTKNRFEMENMQEANRN